MTFAQACAVPETLTPMIMLFFYDNWGTKSLFLASFKKKKLTKFILFQIKPLNFNSFKIEIQLKKLHFQIEIYFQKIHFKSEINFKFIYYYYCWDSFQIEFIGKNQFKFEILLKFTSKDKLRFILILW